MTRYPAAYIGRPFGLAVANGAEQILESNRTAGRASGTPGDADPALCVSPGMLAPCQSRFAKIDAREVRAKVRTKDIGQRGRVGERNADMMIQTARAKENFAVEDLD
jgi:hypothetical protein